MGNTPAVRDAGQPASAYQHANWRAAMADVWETIGVAGDGTRMVDAVWDAAGVSRVAWKRTEMAKRTAELLNLVAWGKAIEQEVNDLYRNPAETVTQAGGAAEVGTRTEHHQ
jgi:hypothetical protein